MSRVSAVLQTCRWCGGRRPRARRLWAAGIERVLLAGLLLQGVACRRPPSPAQASRSREVMGTLATLTAVAHDEAAATAAVEAGYARLEDVNRLMSDYIADSEIGRLNRLPAGTPVPVAAETWACIRRALEVWRASGGAFDVTCRPLVSLWKQAGAQGRLPTAEQIAAVRALVGCDRIVMDETSRTVALPAAGMQIDLGGIAKGQALDLAAAAMRNRGARGALVDVGGDVVAVGTRPDGQPWRVGVKDPFRQGIVLVLRLSDRAVATSGVQQRFHEIGGRRYSHIIDPRTGWPATQAPSVTVIAADGITADAWATAFSVLSVSEGRELISTGRVADVEVLWITGDAGNPVMEKTPGFDQYVVE
jgi:thiamine biosynthesis lipoprotein